MRRKKQPKTPQRRSAKTHDLTENSPPTCSVESPLLTITEACAYFGGSRPLDPSTYYRGIRAGRYPAPIKIGPNIRRVSRSACESALRALAGAESTTS
jgi:predicted DNA-binding transcriptional regulator AlpA